MSESALRLDNITMQFGGVTAVDSFSMNVDKGEIVALIGPNGAGKTTAFNCITGVYTPTNGAVYLFDKKIVANHPKGKALKTYGGTSRDFEKDIIVQSPDKITKLGIARTFQNIRLFKNETVFDNVLVAKHMRAHQNVVTAMLRLNFREEERMRRETADLLHMQDLYQYKDEIADSLPYGLQRRLEIARALATDPKVLLLDEPAAGMNPNETAELSEFIRKIKDEYNLSILLIEHHMDFVNQIADRIYVLDFGKKIAEGTPDEINDNPAVIEAYLGVDENA